MLFLVDLVKYTWLLVQTLQVGNMSHSFMLFLGDTILPDMLGWVCEAYFSTLTVKKSGQFEDYPK